MSLLLLKRKDTVDTNKILDLCERAKYVVKVCKVDATKCITLFPDRKFGKPIYKSEELIHEISKDGEFVKIKRHDNKGLRVIKIPGYAVRSLILNDIFLKCGFLGLDRELVVGYDENNKKSDSVFEILPTLETDSKLEYETSKICTKSLVGLDCSKEIEKLKISSGVSIVNKFAENTTYKFLNEELLD